MSASDLTVEAVRDFMLLKGGRVTNHDLVKHFKNALTNPETRVQARNEFKEIVNTVASIVKTDEGEKQLILKKKYRTPSLQGSEQCLPSPAATPELLPSSSMSSLLSVGEKRTMSHSVSQDSLESATSPSRQPPPYRPPPPPVSTPPPSTSPMGDDAPPVPPRKKSTGSNKENSPDVGRPTTIGAETSVDESDPENKISVKECMQKFQRMASESALQKVHLPASKKRFDKGGSEKDDDTHSVTSLDPKAREWMVKAAQCDYQSLSKMANDNPKLAKFKDPTSGYTAVHWAAKHGNVDVIKLIAGTHKVDVNTKTNGGYTALHIAMQYGHEEIFNLLKDVYGGNPGLRDWSGRKPHQYLTNKDTSVSADTYRKIKARKKISEKESGFLRIGSLNVRVKRTTEAFSHFLGVGNPDKIHKTWGSADNIPQGDARRMPPPKYAPIKKRKSKRAMDFSHRMPPSRPESMVSIKSAGGDSDSDTAAGFGTNWQATV